MRLLTTILLLLLAGSTFSQLADGSVVGNQTVIRITHGSLNTQALLWLPDDYEAEGNEEKEYPLIIFLHGSGQGSSNNITQVTNEALPYLIKNGLKPYGIKPNGDTAKFIVISPHAASTFWSYSIGHLKDILPWALDNYRINANRVYVTGLSAGGGGTWSVASDVEWAKNIAAIVPIAATEYQVGGSMTLAYQRLRQCVVDSLGVIHICGTGDAQNSSHVRYDTCIQNAPPVEGRYYYETISGVSHDSASWNPPYRLTFTQFDGKNLYDKLLEWHRGEEDGEEPEEPTGCGGIRRNITPSSGGRYINGHSYTYNPGDTLVISGSDTWTGGLEIDNFHGTAECPIVIINDGDVQMGAGFNLEHCSYIKITGSGTDSEYGFYIEGVGSGTAVDITGRSRCIEVERLNVYNKNYGVWCKQEADCPDSVWAYTIPGAEDVTSPNGWRIDSVSVHDCKFRVIGQDGLYFGSTSPNGFRKVTCEGDSLFPIPPRLSNIRIYNNLVDSCNRTGIQLSGGDSGTNEIFNNTVLRCGYEQIQTQGSGIILGGVTRAHVYNNYVRQTFQYSILCIGSGTSIIENNDVDSSGYIDDVVNPGYTNIGADTRVTVPADDSVRLIIRNNKVGLNTAEGKQIMIGNTHGTFFSSGTIVCGNKNQGDNAPADIYVAGTINYSTDCEVEPNEPPTVDAGEDQEITTTSTTLTAAAEDSDGTIMQYSWEKVSGPDGDNIVQASSASTEVTFIASGTYVYKVTVQDNDGATAEDTVTVIVELPAVKVPLIRIKRHGKLRYSPPN
jgi:hypothetical protein